MNRKNYLRFGIGILFVGAVLGLILASSFNITAPIQSSSLPHQQTEVVLGSQEKVPEAILELQNTSDAFVQVAEQIVPTVVSIQTTRLISSADLEPFHNRKDLKDLFRFKLPKDFRQQGSGSGIIVSHEGYILTNVHVVDNSVQIRVTLYDNREFQGEIVGLDHLTEVAVIKIEADNLPVARLGNSDECKVGQWVLAIGNPLELRSTVTAGIISAKERQLDIIRDNYGVESFLQTDAAINPGNSGGPLVNLHAEVIGVSTAMASETGYNAGFGFAIPINLAKKIMSDLIQKGKVERGYLGIAMQNIDDKKARALHLDRPRGVFIDRVFENTPAEKAGIKSKDVLLKINDEEVHRSNQVQAIIAKKNPGELLQLTLLRKGKEIIFDVVLGKKEIGNAEYSTQEVDKHFKDVGLQVKDLTRDEALELGYRGRAGVLITEVERWSPADEAGIVVDDILIEIDEVGIENKYDFQKVVSTLEKGSVSIFTVVRGNSESHIFVEIPNH